MPIVKYEKAGKELEIDVPDEAYKKLKTEFFDEGVDNALGRYNKLFRKDFSDHLKDLPTDATLKDISGALSKEIRDIKIALDAKGGDDTELQTQLLDAKKANAELKDKLTEAETNAPLALKKSESLSTVKGLIVGAGLRESHQDDLGYYINKSFSQEVDSQGKVIWTDSKGAVISQGDTASIERKVMNLFKESNGTLFETRKGGAGVPSGDIFKAAGETQDLKESSVDSLLESGLEELSVKN